MATQQFSQLTVADLHAHLTDAKQRRLDIKRGHAILRLRQDGLTKRWETLEEALAEIEAYIAFLSYLIPLCEMYHEPGAALTVAQPSNDRRGALRQSVRNGRDGQR